MDEYLTVNELSARIKFSKQSLYNLIHKRSLVLGKHYLKPTPKKILFKWSEIQIWMGEGAPLGMDDCFAADSGCLGHSAENSSLKGKAKPRSRINI
jgi:hypothetical protein